MNTLQDPFYTFKQNFLQRIDECSKLGQKKPDFVFNDIRQKLSLNLSQADPPNQQMKELQMALSLLETFDLTELYTLHINISNFQGELNLEEILDIHRSLSSLSAVSVIRISERNEEQLQNGIIQPNLNPYSLLTFLSYENPHIEQKYSYILKPAREKTLINMDSKFKNEHYSRTKLKVILSRKSEESYEIPLLRFYEIAKSILPQIISINSIKKDPSTPQILKKIFLIVQNEEITSESESIRRVSSILNFIDLDEARISKFRFEVNQEYVMSEIEADSMETEIESNLELNELKQLKIAAKTKFNFPETLKVEQIQLFLELTKCVQSIKVSFDGLVSPSFTESFELLDPIKEIIENGGCTQLEKLNIRSRNWNSFDFLFQLVEAFPCLKQCKIQMEIAHENPIKFLFSYFQRSISLLKKLDEFYLTKLLEFKQKTLTIIVQQMSIPSYKMLFDRTLPAINSLEKCIYLEMKFQFIGKEQLNQDLIYNFFKKLLNQSAINCITFNGSLFDGELNSISKQRKSLYNSITVYYSLISSFMLFNPDAILLDLFDY